MNPPGPCNNGFNSFDVNRVYLNTYFTPTDDVVFRFTPELYRANGANQTGTTCAQAATLAGCSLNDTFGATTGVGSNLDGDLNLRMKYAYVQFTQLAKSIPLLQGDTLTVGAQPNPLLGWEEDFTQFRYVYLSPWNYIGLSSSQIGLKRTWASSSRISCIAGSSTQESPVMIATGMCLWASCARRR